MWNKHNINRKWTLFLDRDGVVNVRLVDDYVKNIDEFVFIDGVLEALKIFNSMFGRIIIISNQRGIAKGLMTEADLAMIHDYMNSVINENGARIDRIYYCPHDSSDNCECRKPRPGMLQKAKSEFPEINFDKSILVGDSESDIKAGKNMSTYTVYITPSGDKSVDADMYYESLIDFAKSLS